MLQLHEAGKHEHVIALIESALIYGQPKSWMHEVLAISYQVTQRPKEDVERALLSAVDPNADYESMMLSAVYLSRFENQTPSLRMYRQASAQVPFRPEPYIMGLGVARKLKDVDAIAWGVEGIFQYAWSGDYEQYHKLAEVAIGEAEALLKSQGDLIKLKDFQQRARAAQIRDLEIDLRWAGEGDVDLVVEDPAGQICSYDMVHTASGGVHLRDGFGPKQDNCFERFVCVRALNGRYRIKVRHVWGNIVGGKAVLTIHRHGEKPKTITVTLQAKDEQVVPIEVDKGRRERLNPELQKSGRKVSLWRFDARANNVAALRGMSPEQRQVLQEFQEARANNRGLQVFNSAIGYRPIVRQINDGLQLGAAAVVSPDRRYVRVGVNAVFANVVEVFNFSLTGPPSQAPAPNAN